MIPICDFYEMLNKLIMSSDAVLDGYILMLCCCCFATAVVAAAAAVVQWFSLDKREPWFAGR